MIVERTFDVEYIRDCIIEPRNWRLGNPMKLDIDPGLFYPPMNDGVIYLRIRDVSRDYGVLIGIKRGASYEAHLGLLPVAVGKAVAIAKAATRWVFLNTDCLKITADTLANNPLVTRLAKNAGMVQTGATTFELNKEELCQQ